MGKDKDLEASKEGTELDAIIVGAGFSGIASACRIQMDLNLSNFLIFEQVSPSFCDQYRFGPAFPRQRRRCATESRMASSDPSGSPAT